MFQYGFILFSLILFMLQASSLNAYGNACVMCHGGLNKKSVAGKAYQIWKDSVHDKAGVTCDRCHQGNPNGKTLSASHQGMLSPENPDSMTYPSHIPALCGACHQSQLQEFTRSSHYKTLLAGGKDVRGPTCITCHGSMHTAILSPANVAQACRRCHNTESGINPNVPEEAHAVLDLIFYTKNTVRWSGEFVLLAKKQGYAVTAAEAAQKNAERKFHLSKVKWHSFDFHEILKLVDGAYESAKAAKDLSDRVIAEGAARPTPH